MTTVTEPGVYDLTDVEYHADPVPGGSLSQSGARLLLPPSCPARFRWQQDNPPPPKPQFDLGHAAHLLVLGAGPELVVIEANDWRTKAAKEARGQAHADGRVPLLAAQHDQVQAMATALRQHPIAGELLDPARMIPERSIFWRDEQTEVWRRARLDAVSRPDGDPVIVDYKTTRSADLRHIEKAMWDYGYAAQAEWYGEGAAAVGLAGGDAAFFFVFQEIEPPYLVTVVEPDATALMVGRKRNREAIELYAACVKSGQWPGHAAADEIPLVSVPAWAARQHIEPLEEIL